METEPRLHLTASGPVDDPVLPDDWQPSDDAMLALSIALDIDVNAATVQFLDRYRGRRLSEATPAGAPRTSWLGLWCIALVLEDGRRQEVFRRQLRATKEQIDAAREIGEQLASSPAQTGALWLVPRRDR
ncbi:hypothetical protein ACWDTG_15870 [Rhodococcus zopfii]